MTKEAVGINEPLSAVLGVMDQHQIHYVPVD
jgi:hypothetical protein